MHGIFLPGPLFARFAQTVHIWDHWDHPREKSLIPASEKRRAIQKNRG